MRVPSFIARVGFGGVSLIALACSTDFSTARTAPPAGTLGRVLYSVVCDRVGAQSLPMDVTGASFASICHPDPATGKYGDSVDVTQLPPLQDPAYTADGYLIPIARQQASRAYEVSRIEALGRDREEIVAALDRVIPDSRVPVLPSPAGAPSCDPPVAAADVSFQAELGATMGRLLDLYDDADRTLPSVTRALGRSLDDIKRDPDVQAALARLDARQGYRPLPIALGVAREVLEYPRFVELTRSVVSPLLAQPGQTEGPEAQAYDALMSAGYRELLAPASPAPAIDLGGVPDPLVPGRVVLSRPRSVLEAMRDVLSYATSSSKAGSPDYLVQRDSRGYASVPLVNGAVPAPFVDLTGPSGAPDGLPDVGPLGQFLTSNGAPPVSPFFSPGAPDGTRDSYGRALLAPGGGALMYGYVDAYQTALAAIAHDIEPFFAVGGPTAKETAMDALAAVPVLGGARDASSVTTKVYPPDPYAMDDWKIGHSGPPPAGLASAPVSLSYRAFHPESSPLVDLVYAIGQVLATPELDDLLALAQKLFADHPGDVASLMGLALEIHATAAGHPEAKLPLDSTLWDDLFVKLGPVAHEPGLLEDILRAFADPKTLPMEQALETFLSVKDDVSYDTGNLNGPSKDLDTGTAPANFLVPVDRSQPDVGANRSEMQKFLSLLHDTNGLSICTKDGAVVHIRATLPNSTLPINFDYPTDPVFTPLVCGIVGAAPPTHLNRCAVFGYQNVMSLLLDVLLGKAQLTVNDPCLNKLMSSPITAVVGGADAFLQQISGVNGFSLHPNLRGFARLLYFQTPYPGLPADTTPANAQTSNFLKDTIDPIPSMVCDPSPYTTPDGTVFPLRTCSSVNDVLRARDPDALFPVDELGFVASLQPLAGAFDKHHRPLLFADLFDVLHLHWGSSAQPSAVCDPTLPRSNARWCSQDGLVSYEPLLAEVLHNGVFGRLQSFVGALGRITVDHCTAFDPQTHLCKSTVQFDGIHVAAEALSVLLDRQRTPGLVDRAGSGIAQRCDGQKTDPLTGMDLLVQAFKNVDRSFSDYASANPGDTGRHAMWLAARSSFVDAFLAVNGQGAQATFANPTLIDVLPRIIGIVRDQVAAHCGPGAPCAWAQADLASGLAESMRGPTFAATVDLLDALRQDDGARAEIERLVTYLLDSASANDAQASTLAAALDLTQTLVDDTNLPPFERVLARALAPPVTDAAGKVVQRSLADAGLRAMSRIFQLQAVGSGSGACVKQRDPNRTIGVLLRDLVEPAASDQLTPIEILMNSIADVNRADPSATTKLDGNDYGNIANEMSELCLDPTRGLEQFYAVIRQITGD